MKYIGNKRKNVWCAGTSNLETSVTQKLFSSFSVSVSCKMDVFTKIPFYAMWTTT